MTASISSGAACFKSSARSLIFARRPDVEATLSEVCTSWLRSTDLKYLVEVGNELHRHPFLQRRRCTMRAAPLLASLVALLPITAAAQTNGTPQTPVRVVTDTIAGKNFQYPFRPTDKTHVSTVHRIS